MKKLATLLLAAGMVVASTAPANAVDVKVDGRYRFSFSTGEKGFQGANQEVTQQRVRLGLTMTASENLSGYFQLQAGKDKWGTSTNVHGAYAKDSVTARMVYIDWTVPTTAIKVRMGRHQFGLPADAFGANAVLAAGWGVRDGIVVSAPVTDWLGVSGLWMRAGSDGGADLDQNKSNDVFAAIANLKFNGISGSVYAAYASVDGFGSTDTYAPVYNKVTGEADEDTGLYADPGVEGFKKSTASNQPACSDGLPNVDGDAFWVGATAKMTFFDPFTLAVSGAYGEFNAADKGDQNLSGWNVQAKASYKLDFGTPVLGAWYFSGADEDGKGIMPTCGGYFTPTRTYHDNANGLNGGQAYYLPAGNWGVQAGIEGMSFLSGLSHDFLVTYIKGTNDKDWDGCTDEYLSEDDALVSIDFINTYKIYKNLAAHLEFSYIVSDFNKDAKDDGYDKNDWRAELTFEYKF